MMRAFLILLLFFALLAPARAQDAVTELLLRVEQLEGQLRLMNGKVEELEFKNRRLDEQLKRYQADTDFRFQEMSNKPSAPAASGTPQKKSEGQELTPRDLSSVPASSAPQVGSATGSLTGDPKDQYELGYGLVKRGDYELGAVTLEGFLKDHPQHKLVPNAHYWLGESLAKRGKNKEAATHFLKIVQSYPNNNRGPDAMVRLGASLGAIGEKDAACSALQGFAGQYPKASDALKQQAVQEQRKLRCG